jgi:hypothetical protein
VSGGILLFAVLSGAYGDEMSNPHACAATPFGRTVDFKQQFAFQKKDRT